MTNARLVLIVALALFLSACGGQMASAPMPAAESAAMATAAPVAAAGDDEKALEYSSGATDSSGVANQAQQPASQRLVIKNATISLQVEDVNAVEAQIRTSAERLGGYVVSVQTSGSDTYRTATVTFRVPADRFEQALSGVEGLSRKVLGRTVSGDDVTEEFVDLESRLRNLEATRDRLLELLTKATRVEDALQVNQALTDVQGQIEQIQGRMKYLQQSAALSTISVDLQPVPPPPSIIQPDGWQPLLVAQEALAGLVSFGQGLASVAIVALVWSPVWLPIALLARWAMRRITLGKPKAPTV